MPLREVVVASGKGGTGKTLVAAALALHLEAIAVDCDVEAPDLRFLLKDVVALIAQQEVHESRKAVIDAEKCVRCLRCAEVCHFGAIHVNSHRVHIDPILCEGCGACVHACPHEAVSLYTTRTGYVVTAETGSGILLVYGDLAVGGRGSGHLVYAVKAEAQKLARQREVSLLIIDAAAGIGCPVISSIAGASHLIVVVEPTIQSLQGAKRLLEATHRFNLSKALVINKVTNEHQILLLQNSLNLPLLGVIPYDPSIPSIYASTTSPFEASDRVVKCIVEVCNRASEWLE